MKTNTILLSIAICLSCFALKAQDLHYSNYNYAPLYLNPATTGGFNGSIRVGASHRDQFRTFIGEAYQSTMIFADSPISFIVNEKMWLGVGINLFSDKVGDLGFGMSGITGSAAFHYSLDDKYNTVFAVGVQYGMVQRKIGNETNAVWADELPLGAMRSQDQNLLQNFNATFADINVGATMKHWLSKSNLWEVGISAHHLNDGKFRFSNSSFENRIKPRFNAFTSLQIQTSSKFQITPAAYFSQYDNVSNLQVQLNTKTLIKGKKKKKGNAEKLRSQSFLTLGIGYRIGDAVQFFAGGIHKSWEFGLSYDLTTSSAFRYNNTVGGLELGVKKYITIHQKPEIKIIKICPRV